MDIETLVVLSIGAIIMIASWIANAAKKYQENREAEQSRQRPQAGSGELDESARRRREQLRQAARQRMQGPSARQGGGDAGEPQNLSMADRIARARAKAQYEQRAGELRGAGGQAGPSQQPTAEHEQAERQAQRRQAEETERRQRAEAQAEAQRRRQAQARQQQQRQQRQSQQQRRQQLQRQRQLQQQRQRQQQMEQVRTEGRRRPASAREETRARRTPPMRRARQPARAVPRAAGPKAGPLDLSALSGGSLRQAMVLKEILDRPVALRDPVEQSL